MNTLNQFFFGIYTYICLSVFFLGSLMRFEREQYSWKSDSSQLLYEGQLRLGNILFHVGVLAVFFGHLFGLLTPLAFWEFLGISHGAKLENKVVLVAVILFLALIKVIRSLI